MPITRKFRETVWTRAQDDTRFREAMLTEAINELLAGDLNAGKAITHAWPERQPHRRKFFWNHQSASSV